jgi:hypothetical protein
MPSTKNWIATNIRDGENISEESYQSIADFCVMWALFEGTELHGINVVVDELKNVAYRIANKIQNIECALEFWRQRYICEGQTNQKFEHLNLTHQPHRDLVSRVLLGIEIEQETVTLALLLIIYRLRNNLFHGIKDITTIRHQASNLDMASDFLKNSLLASGR